MNSRVGKVDPLRRIEFKVTVDVALGDWSGDEVGVAVHDGGAAMSGSDCTQEKEITVRKRISSLFAQQNGHVRAHRRWHLREGALRIRHCAIRY